MGLAVAGAMESRIAKSANRTARLYITYKLILRLAVRKMTGKVVPVQERLVTVQKRWGSPCGGGRLRLRRVSRPAPFPSTLWWFLTERPTSTPACSTRACRCPAGVERDELAGEGGLEGGSH